VDEHALELGERLFVEGDGVEVAGLKAGVLQAGEGGGERQAGVVLDPRQPLLLDRGDDLAVDHERRGGVVVVRGDAEDAGHITYLLCQPGRIGRARRTSSASGAASTYSSSIAAT
jgi:hypothetical protein